MNEARRAPQRRKPPKKDSDHNDSIDESFVLNPVAESKMELFGGSSSSLSGFDFGGSSSSLSGFDLPRNYQNAIECLMQCDSIISTLEGQLAAKEKTISDQEKTISDLEKELASHKAIGPLREQLARKDERISALEERMVRMSIELANSKAFEDRHRSSRRGGGDDDSAASEPSSDGKPPRGALDVSNPSSEGSGLSDGGRYVSRGSVMGVFHMFGSRNRGMGKDLKGSDDEKAPTKELKDDQQKERPEASGDGRLDASGDGDVTDGDLPPLPRFVPPKRRMTMEERQLRDSRNFLEGVAFPTAHDSFSVGI